MRRLIILTVILLAASLAGCSLAEDVTPPPALATQQSSIPSAATVRPQATSPADAVPVELDLVPADAPDPLAGMLTYVEHCSPCHGPEGLGDGELAGSLDVAAPSLGEPALAIQASPAEWYEIVTVGRMDRLMPPFRSLSDAERWDVVAYALSLSTTQGQIESGEGLYQQACAECHGEDGRGGEYTIDLTALEASAARSLAETTALIEEGAGEMPAFGEVFEPEDRLALAIYVRTLGYQGETLQETQASEEESEEEAPLGTVRISVLNGTEGASVPGGLEVTVVGFDGDAQSLEEVVAVDSQGLAEIEGLEIASGRIFGAIVEYQGVQYFSTGGHLLADDPLLELELTIYETTPDVDLVEVDRLHVIFDYAVEGIVEVSELWLINNNSDRTVVQRGGSNALPFELPEGFGGLRFGDQALGQRVTPTEDGFVFHEPIRPGEPQEVIFTFTIPYERSLNFVQPIDYPVGAVVLLTEASAPDLSGSGLTDEGTREMGELVLRTYSMGALEPGSSLALNFRGRHPAASSNLSTTNLLIGAGVLLVTLAVVLFGWQRWAQERGEQVELDADEPAGEAVGLPSRTALLEAIAALDDAFESGDLEQSAYEKQRAVLKQQLVLLMSEDDD